MRMLIAESTENMGRVDRILQLHSKIDELNIGSKEERSELLRAAVVLLHASIEEVIRNLFVEYLPRGDTDILNELSYSVYGPTNKSKGALLGDLLKNHGGRFVENVIVDAINSHVDRLNINNSDQLVAQLRKVKIDIGSAAFLESLDKLMKRRHQIVHQMDREDALDPESRPISEISATEVREWFISALEFNNLILRNLPDNVAL